MKEIKTEEDLNEYIMECLIGERDSTKIVYNSILRGVNLLAKDSEGIKEVVISFGVNQTIEENLDYFNKLMVKVETMDYKELNMRFSL